jgi:hypothetical protein
MVHTTDTEMLGTSGFEHRESEAHFTPSWATEWLQNQAIGWLQRGGFMRRFIESPARKVSISEFLHSLDPKET